MIAFKRISVADHARDKLVIDNACQHLRIALHQVLEYLEVSLALRQGTAILDSHCLPDDKLGDFAVGTIHTLVIDVERIALGAFDDLNIRSFGE